MRLGMKSLVRKIAAFSLILTLWAMPGADAATLLPPGKNCFFTAAGAVNASGTVAFYVPQTLSPKDTWTDAAQTTLNTNPVVLDAAGCSVIYGAGVYRQILKDSLGNTIWDQPTADGHSLSFSWAGTSTGSANAQVVTLSTFDLTDGQMVTFLASISNTSAMTLNVSSTGAVAVTKETGAGPVALVGGEVVAGNVITVVYVSSTGQFQIVSPTPIQSFNSAIFFDGVITPTILAANQNDWTPTGGFSGANTVRVASTTSINITGMTGGASGRTVFMHNVGSNTVTFTSEGTASTAANRFLFGAPTVLLPNMAATFQYDGTSSRWRQINPVVTTPIGGAFTNLALTNGATPNTQMVGTANAFTLQDASGNVVRRTSLNCTADSAVAGAGGLDTGSFTVSTWYSYWFIYNPATNTDSCLLSTASAFGSLTLPSGYTFGARAGWNRTIAAAAQFNRILQKGDRTQYVVSATVTTALPRIADTAAGAVGNTTAGTYIAVPVGNYVPTTAKSIIGICSQIGNATNQRTIIAPNNLYGASSSTTLGPPVMCTDFADANGGINMIFNMALESTNIYWAASAANSGFIYALGWEDNL